MDQNKFVNTYIDTAINTLHEFTSNALQLKTQLKIANDLIQEKDEVIASVLKDKENILARQTEDISSKDAIIASKDEQIISLNKELAISSSELSSTQKPLKELENINHSLLNKVAHMDTLVNQMNDMKRQIIERNQKIESLEKQIEELNAPKPSINRRRKKQTDSVSTPPLIDESVKTEERTDDF
jgi:chromosome segregation ATPase